jgi:hypothetical protein
VNWKEIDWDYYPKPYSDELPHYIEKAYQRLSPEGAQVLDELVQVAAHTTGDAEEGPSWDGEGGEEALVERLEALPEWDSQAIVALSKRLGEALEAHEARTQGELGLLRDAGRVVRRARVLDPNFPEDAAIGQAVEVLRAHGEAPGFSDEVLEIPLEVPPSEASDEE